MTKRMKPGTRPKMRTQRMGRRRRCWNTTCDDCRKPSRTTRGRPCTVRRQPLCHKNAHVCGCLAAREGDRLQCDRVGISGVKFGARPILLRPPIVLRSQSQRSVGETARVCRHPLRCRILRQIRGFAADVL